MPHYLFQPIARQYPKLTFATIKAIANAFEVSHTAAAIRLIEADHTPALLICHSSEGRKWFIKAPSVPSRWFPRDGLDADSFAFDVLHAAKPDDAIPRKIGAAAWFDCWEASRFEIHEQSMRTGDDEVLTLVLIGDEEMLKERENRRGWRTGA